MADQRFANALVNGFFDEASAIYKTTPPRSAYLAIIAAGPQAIENFLGEFANPAGAAYLASDLIRLYRPEYKEYLRRAARIASEGDRYMLSKETGTRPELEWFRQYVSPQTNELSGPARGYDLSSSPYNRLARAIEDEDMATVQELAGQGVLGNATVVQPALQQILRQALYRKLKPRYENGEAETAQWVRWLVQNGA
jgi:hypothetical protein